MIFQEVNMKRVILVILLAVLLVLTLCSCGNRKIFDTTYKFTYAYVELPNGEIVEGKVDNWRDYEDGDQLQVTINGVTYLTNSTRIVLVSD